MFALAAFVAIGGLLQWRSAQSTAEKAAAASADQNAKADRGAAYVDQQATQGKGGAITQALAGSPPAHVEAKAADQTPAIGLWIASSFFLIGGLVLVATPAGSRPD